MTKKRRFAGKLVDHAGIYGSKAAEGFSVFHVCLVD